MTIAVSPTALSGAEQDRFARSIPEFVALRHDLHSPAYRFNDAIIAPAAALWVALTRRFLTGEAP